MEERKITSVRGLLEQMPTEQLDALLDQELHSENIDDNAVLMILNILEERDKDEPVVLTPKMEAAWENYKRKMRKMDQEHERRARMKRFAVRAASAAAVLVLLLTVIPQQAQAESFWDRLTRWTAEFLEFFGPEDNEHRIVEYEFKTDHPGLQQVYDTVVELGITVPVVPMWLPAGYELTEIQTDFTPVKDVLYSRFENGDSEIILNVENYHSEISRKYQNNGSVIGTYENNGVTHCIMNNTERLVAVWTRDQIECSISVDCQEDVLREILKTIYVMEAE